MTTKKVTTKGSTKGKAEGSRKTLSAAPAPADDPRQRVEELIATNKYGDKVSDALRRMLAEKPDQLPAMLARVEAADQKLWGKFGAAFKEGAIDYAFKAYAAALDHYHANQGDPFALSRLAVVYEEQQPGDFNMVVTLPGVMRDRAIDDDDLRKVIKDAERIARTLEDPECSEAYRKAFVSIYTDHLLNIGGVNWEHPAAVRLMIPLVMLDLWRNRPADADTALEILSITLRDALNSDEVSERTRAANG